MRRFLALLLCGLALGCGVMDQLDDANKAMDKEVASKQRAAAIRNGQNPAPLGSAAGGAAAPGARPGPAGRSAAKPPEGLIARAERWWKEAREEKPTPPAPDDRIVSCKIHGTTTFVLKSACLSQDGLPEQDLGKPSY
jgi:hypothetical protein